MLSTFNRINRFNCHRNLFRLFAQSRKRDNAKNSMIRHNEIFHRIRAAQEKEQKRAIDVIILYDRHQQWIVHFRFRLFASPSHRPKCNSISSSREKWTIILDAQQHTLNTTEWSSSTDFLFRVINQTEKYFRLPCVGQVYRAQLVIIRYEANSRVRVNHFQMKWNRSHFFRFVLSCFFFLAFLPFVLLNVTQSNVSGSRESPKMFQFFFSSLVLHFDDDFNQPATWVAAARVNHINESKTRREKKMNSRISFEL